jgi:hypothetical protein
MANETVIDKAMAFLPIGRKPAKKRPTSEASRKKQIAEIQRKLAKLNRDVAALASLVAPPKKPSTTRKRSGGSASSRTNTRPSTAKRSAHTTTPR